MRIFHVILLLLVVSCVQARSPPPISDRYSLQAVVISDWFPPRVYRNQHWLTKAFHDASMGYALAYQYDSARIVWTKQSPSANTGTRNTFGNFYCRQSPVQAPASGYFNPWYMFSRSTFVKKDTIKRSYTLYCDVFTVATSEGTHLFWVTLDSRSVYPNNWKIARHVFNSNNAAVRHSFTFEVMSIGFGDVDRRAFQLPSRCASTGNQMRGCCIGVGCCDEKEHKLESTYQDQFANSTSAHLGADMAHLGWNPSEEQLSQDWFSSLHPSAFTSLF